MLTQGLPFVGTPLTSVFGDGAVVSTHAFGVAEDVSLSAIVSCMVSSKPKPSRTAHSAHSVCPGAWREYVETVVALKGSNPGGNHCEGLPHIYRKISVVFIEKLLTSSS